MSVSSVETLNGAIAASSSASPTITTTLRASDRVVVMLIKSSTPGTPSVSGLGATWTNHQAGTSLYDHYLWSATGITGGGTITVSVGSASGDYVAWALRSSVDSAITHHGSSRNDTTVAADTPVQAPDISSADAGMFAVAGAACSGTLTFPHANMLPPSGWTTDRNGTNSTSRFLSRQLSAAGTVRAVSSADGIASHVILAGVFTDGDTGAPPPLTSTFTGWGAPIF